MLSHPWSDKCFARAPLSPQVSPGRTLLRTRHITQGFTPSQWFHPLESFCSTAPDLPSRFSGGTTCPMPWPRIDARQRANRMVLGIWSQAGGVACSGACGCQRLKDVAEVPLPTTLGSSIAIKAQGGPVPRGLPRNLHWPRFCRNFLHYTPRTGRFCLMKFPNRLIILRYIEGGTVGAESVV